MAPSHSRQLLVWTLPTIAVLLSYLWYKRKRIGSQSDPGDAEKSVRIRKEEPEEVEEETPQQSPNKTFSRSLSGVDSAPIDIVIPPTLKAVRSNPVVISDEDLDLEIKKIKSMKYGGSIDLRQSTPPKVAASVKANSPPARISVTTPVSKKNVPDSPVETSPVMAENVTKDGATPTTMEVLPQQEDDVGRDEEFNRQNSERDSANHSPVDVIMASPSLSSISDNHSEGSNDSGKGGSEVVTPPPSRAPRVAEPEIDVPAVQFCFEFAIPKKYVGKLIGRHGANVKFIQERTGGAILVREHPGHREMQVATVHGSEEEINGALKMIRKKFPLRRYPDITLEEIRFLPSVPALPFLVELVQDIINDTVVCCIVNSNHFFMQQPSHPSFHHYLAARAKINQHYSNESPLMPTPIGANTLCIVNSMNVWLRALVISYDESDRSAYVKLVDDGGFIFVQYENIRQIREEFMLFPFQAAECFLANILPIEETLSAPAREIITDLVNGMTICTQVFSYTECGIPVVNCYIKHGRHYIYINQEIVTRGCAAWVPPYIEQPPEGAVANVEPL